MKIPTFTSTEESLAFGKTATPKQKAILYKLRRIALHKSNKAIAQGEHQEALNLAVEAQFYRESLEASEKKP